MMAQIFFTSWGRKNSDGHYHWSVERRKRKDEIKRLHYGIVTFSDKIGRYVFKSDYHEEFGPELLRKIADFVEFAQYGVKKRRRQNESANNIRRRKHRRREI